MLCLNWLLVKKESWEPVQLVSFELCDDAYFTVLLFSILAAPSVSPTSQKKNNATRGVIVQF